MSNLQMIVKNAFVCYADDSTQLAETSKPCDRVPDLSSFNRDLILFR